MSRRRLERAAAVSGKRSGEPVDGYVVVDDAVLCSRCGHRLPVYAGKALRGIHDAKHGVGIFANGRPRHPWYPDQSGGRS